MINLAAIVENIKNDQEIDKLSIDEQLDIQTYYYLAESVDLNDYYEFKSTDKFSATFVDSNGITHFTRIIFQPLTEPRYDVKFGFMDKNGKPSYDRPNIHYNLTPDGKIFNTHAHILLIQFLEKDKFFDKVKDTSNELHLPATDYSRYRLYKMILTKLLDKSKYQLYSGGKNELIIRNK